MRKGLTLAKNFANGEVVGGVSGLGKQNLINPGGRIDNCTACVAANILNKIQRNPIDNLITAQQIEVKFGYTGAKAGLSESQSLSYIEKATNTTAVKTPIAARNAPVGNYAVYATSENGGHVLYGQVLSNGKYYFYDPQIASRAMTLEQARAQYNLVRTYFMKPNP